MKGQLTTCRLCGASGLVYLGRRLKSERVKTLDSIPHERECKLYVGAQPRHLRKKKWRGQEKRANALVGARETLASGALNEDGDGRAFHEWRVESKQTVRRSYNLSQAVWSKLVKGALLSGEEPVLHVEVYCKNLSRARFVVVRKDLYDAFHGEAPKALAENLNKKSYRINAWDQPPFLVDLEPLGVAVHEIDLQKMKKELEDDNRRADLRGAP
jgi:hypothetical protein